MSDVVQSVFSEVRGALMPLIDALEAGLQKEAAGPRLPDDYIGPTIHSWRDVDTYIPSVRTLAAQLAPIDVAERRRAMSDRLALVKERQDWIIAHVTIDGAPPLSLLERITAAAVAEPRYPSPLAAANF